MPNHNVSRSGSFSRTTWSRSSGKNSASDSEEAEDTSFICRCEFRKLPPPGGGTLDASFAVQSKIGNLDSIGQSVNIESAGFSGFRNGRRFHLQRFCLHKRKRKVTSST